MPNSAALSHDAPSRSPTSRQTSTIVIGGGVIGLSLAWELSRRGVRVTVLERNRTGRATSWAATGILPAANERRATDPLEQLRGMSHRLFPDWSDELKRVTGIDNGFRRCGGWYLAETPGERAALGAMTSYWDELEISCESVSAADLARREPALAPWASHYPSASAWWTADECQVRSPDHLRALTAACRQAGVQIVERTEVVDVHWNNDSVTVSADRPLPDGARDIQADQAVLCGGAWTGLIADQLNLQASLVPVRGQILMLKSDRPLLGGIVNVGNRYLLCREDGRTLVGSCEEEVGFQSGTTAAVLDSLRMFANRLCPELADAPIEKTWSGFRPMTFDGFPMIGRVPQTSNVYVASGHYRSGIHFSCATAVLLADELQGKTPAIRLEPFRVGKQQAT